MDHFHAPRRKKRHWESVHSSWTAFIARRLNRKPLPLGFIAEPHVSLGATIAADVAGFEEDAPEPYAEDTVAPAGAWIPPPPSVVTPVDVLSLGVCEVRVYDDELTRMLVAAVEIISPANKDRPRHRRALVAECAAYLQQDVSVVLVVGGAGGRGHESPGQPVRRAGGISGGRRGGPQGGHVPALRGLPPDEFSAAGAGWRFGRPRSRSGRPCRYCRSG